jgi:dipeptide/tripeptide permease
MGVFFTTYYAIMSASPPIAGWLFDRTGGPDSAILFGAALFALVLPVAILFRMLKTGAAAEPLKETA